MAGSPRRENQNPGPYEEAFLAALDDLAVAKAEILAAEADLLGAEERGASLEELARNLFNALPPDRQAEHIPRLRKIAAGKPPSSKGGPVYDNVVELFARSTGKQWTASEVQHALSDKGLGAEPKAIYNVLDYLARKGGLRRVSRGRYVVAGLGIGIETGHDLPEVDHYGGHCPDD